MPTTSPTEPEPECTECEDVSVKACVKESKAGNTCTKCYNSKKMKQCVNAEVCDNYTADGAVKCNKNGTKFGKTDCYWHPKDKQCVGPEKPVIDCMDFTAKKDCKKAGKPLDCIYSKLMGKCISKDYKPVCTDYLAKKATCKKSKKCVIGGSVCLDANTAVCEDFIKPTKKTCNEDIKLKNVPNGCTLANKMCTTNADEEVDACNKWKNGSGCERRGCRWLPSPVDKCVT